MIGVLLATILASAPAAPAVAEAPGNAEDVDCPAPKAITPRYPLDLARAKKTGLVLVGARFDDCGRVVETRVDESSGRKLFDQAAEDAVAQYVLAPAQRAKAQEGWVQIPIKFGGFRNVEAYQIPWPRSHRKPLYLPDEESLPFTSIEEFEEADVLDMQRELHPPYGMARVTDGRIFRTSMYPEEKDPDTFWLSYIIQPAFPASPTAPIGPSTVAAIARYRLVEEDGVPVVRLGLLCERPADECERLREFLFKGLPFAKARRR